SSGRPMRERCRNGLGVLRGNLEQGSGWPLGTAAALLPVLERGDTHADHGCELRLRFSQSLPDRLHIERLELGYTAWRALPPPDLAGLPDTGDQGVKVLFLHPNSSPTIRLKRRS